MRSIFMSKFNANLTGSKTSCSSKGKPTFSGLNFEGNLTGLRWGVWF